MDASLSQQRAEMAVSYVRHCMCVLSLCVSLFFVCVRVCVVCMCFFFFLMVPYCNTAAWSLSASIAPIRDITALKASVLSVYDAVVFVRALQ